MSILQITLLTVTLVMVVRQVLLIGKVNGLIARFGRVQFTLGFWAHLYATVALCVATVASFTGVVS